MVIGRLPRRCLASLLSSSSSRLSLSSLRSPLFAIQSNNASSSAANSPNVSPPSPSPSPSTASSPSHCCKCAATAATISSMKKQEEEMLKMADVMCEKMRTMMKQYVMDVMQHRHDEISAMMEDVGEKQMEEGEKMIAAKENKIADDVILAVVDVAGNGNGDARKEEDNKTQDDDSALAKQNEGGGETKSKKKLPSDIVVVERLRSSIWSHDGKSFYAIREEKTEELVEIDVESGKARRVIHEQRYGYLISLALSKSGDIFFGDSRRYGSGEVHVVSSASGGIIRTIGSGKGDGDGKLHSPSGICVVDEWNELFVCDGHNYCIQVFSMDDGHFIRKFDLKREKPQSFSPYASKIAVDASAGLVFVSGRHPIQVFDRYGNFVRMFGSEGKGDGKVIVPCGIVVDTVTKQIIVGGEGNHRLCRFDYDGNFKASIRTPRMTRPSSISMNSDRQLLVHPFCSRAVFFFDSDVWSDVKRPTRRVVGKSLSPEENFDD